MATLVATGHGKLSENILAGAIVKFYVQKHSAPAGVLASKRLAFVSCAKSFGNSIGRHRVAGLPRLLRPRRNFERQPRMKKAARKINPA